MKRIINKGKGIAALVLAVVLAVTSIPLFSLPVFADTANLSISPASQTAPLGSFFDITVDISVDEESRSAQLSMNWDPALVQLNSVTEGTFYSSWASGHGASTIMIAGTINNTAGTLTGQAISILGGSAGGANGSGQLMTLHFQALSTNGLSPITITDAMVGDVSSLPFGTLNLLPGQVITGFVPMPNLVVTSKTETETFPGSGLYTVDYEVCNIGSLASGACVTRIYVNGAPVDNQVCSALAVSGCEASSSIAIPLNDGDVVMVCADINNDVAESDEGDNCLTNTFSSVTDADDIIITGDIDGIIEITAPADISGWNLQVGDNCQSGTVHVRSNGKYAVLVSDDDATTGGHMTQWNGVAYLAKSLVNPMRIGNNCSAPSIGDLAGPVTLVDDQACTDVAGRDHAVSFHQLIDWADDTLPAGQVYRIVVTFTALQTGPCD